MSGIEVIHSDALVSFAVRSILEVVDGSSFREDPPLVSIVPTDSELLPHPVRYRHAAPKIADKMLWQGENADLEQVRTSVELLARKAGKAVAWRGERTTIMELHPFGYFAWRQGQWDMATMVRTPDASGHETLAAIEAFLERRSEIGDGQGTGPWDFLERERRQGGA